MGRSLLLLVSGFIIIFGIIQNSVQNQQRVLNERAPEYFYQEQSRNIAGGMLEIALGNLNGGLTYLTPDDIDNISVDMLGGTGTINIDSTTNFNTRLFVTITGEIERPDSTRSVTEINARFNRTAFSIYAYFTNNESSGIAFGSDDVLTGPVHTNGTFLVRGNPIFNGPITSPNGWVDDTNNNSSNPTFNGGANFDANNVELPVDVPEVVQLADQGGLKFDEKIKVEFQDDQVNIREYRDNGTQYQCVQYGYFRGYRYCVRYGYVSTFTEISNINYDLNSFNGVISSSEDVEVKGRLDGQLTLHSEKDVNITGDIVYKNRNYDNPDNGPISDDRLGIVSEGETIVDENAHSDSGSRDVYIDASILTLGDSFRVENYNRQGDYRGTLHLLGGLIQRERGPVGTGNSSGVSTGFGKDYTYDTRFAQNSTPGFPRKKNFEIENWRESTSIKPLN